VTFPEIEPHVLAYHYLQPPPSTNKAYYNAPGGGRRKTKLAERWQARFSGSMAQARLFSVKKLQDMAAVGAIIHLQITLFLLAEEVLNINWAVRYVRGKKKGQRKAQSRYKKMDVSNRVKLVEDAVADLIGIDDRANFSVSSLKFIVGDKADRGVRVRITMDDPRAFGVPEEFVGPE